MSLVDFVPPSTVLALWFALIPERRKHLRMVFGTAVQPHHKDTDRLEVLDRLLDAAGEEVPAAIDLLGIITSPNPVVEELLADCGITDPDLPAEVLLDLRQFSRRLLTADTPAAVTALIDERWPQRELPPKPAGVRLF